MVIYADHESFSFMNPEGHMFAAMITFSSYEEDGSTVAQVQALLRANDPAWEFFFRLSLISKMEDKFWTHTLHALAEEFGVSGQVEMRAVCVDPKWQWSQAKNIWYNAAMRSGLYAMAAPLRWLRKRGRA